MHPENRASEYVLQRVHTDLIRRQHDITRILRILLPRQRLPQPFIATRLPQRLLLADPRRLRTPEQTPFLPPVRHLTRAHKLSATAIQPLHCERIEEESERSWVIRPRGIEAR
jgi:hypothetical protein